MHRHTHTSNRHADKGHGHGGSGTSIRRKSEALDILRSIAREVCRFKAIGKTAKSITRVTNRRESVGDIPNCLLMASNIIAHLHTGTHHSDRRNARTHTQSCRKCGA